MKLSPKDVEYITELVDIIAEEKPIPFESYKYESAREVAVSGAIDMYLETGLAGLSEGDIVCSNISVVAYLMLENMILHLELERQKGKKEK